MRPILFEFFNIKIYTYGFFMAIAFLMGLIFIKREAARYGESPEKMGDLTFYIIIFGLIGARLFYIITDLKAYLLHPLEIFKIWNGGLTFYGGFIAAFFTTVIYLKKHRMSLLKTMDIMAPGVALGHFFGRIGCFFAGCCYGKECNLPWSVIFTNTDTLAPANVHLHPTQLYSSLNNLIIFLILLLIRKYKKFTGEIFLIYIFLYGITRSIVETFRGDYRGHVFFNHISISQIIGTSAAFIALIAFIYMRRKSGKRLISKF
ncbi:MAG: prolipoprotein diacylglyceryl transferase [Deltaproteobacteria bacterium]|nr:prolipoprotein diacylglyceryl transferase [Deltaproteobacteria bacterium]